MKWIIVVIASALAVYAVHVAQQELGTAFRTLVYILMIGASWMALGAAIMLCMSIEGE